MGSTVEQVDVRSTAPDGPAAAGPGANRRLVAATRRWVAAGIIEEAQADAILAAEPGTGPSRSSLLAEVLAYLGSALVVAAVAVLVGDRWSEFSPLLQVLLVTVATAAGLVAGGLARGRRGDASARVTSVLWLASLGGVAGLCGLVLGERNLDVPGDVAALVTVVVTLTVGAVLYALHRGALQLVPVVGLSAAVAPLALQLTGTEYQPAYGALVLAAGVAWLAQSFRPVLRPGPVGFVAGGVVAYTGCMILADEWVTLGLALAVLGALGLVLVSLRTRELVHLFVGAVGLFVTLPRFAVEVFGESVGAPLALLAVGVLVIAVAVLTGRLHRRSDRTGNGPVDLRASR